MSSSLILHNNNEYFLNQIVMWDKKWILYDNWQQLVQWLDQEKQLQSRTCTKKRSWSLVVCCPSDPLQLSESQWNRYIWEVRLVNRWDALTTPRLLWHWAAAGAQFFPRQCLTAHRTTSAAEAEWPGLWSFASSAIFTWPFASWLPLLPWPFAAWLPLL